MLYRVEGRAVWTVFNEKILAGLGRDLALTGRLSAEGVEAAMAALRRFSALVAAVKPDRVFAVATAAARDAEDGPAFCRRVRAETGLDLRVLSGAEEARYAALGVLAGAPGSAGTAGDLGGASLELIRLGEPDHGVTLPLGPFAFRDTGRFDPDRIQSQVERRLKPHAERLATPVFHAVGGAWRNVALLAMRMSAYPLEIVHQYELTRREALEAAHVIARQSVRSLEKIEGISKRRLETLPHAAAVLEGLVEALGVERVVLSAYGLREGVLFEAMPEACKVQDPLIEGCTAWSGREGANPQLGAAVEAWTAPAFAGLEPVLGVREPVLVSAACRLADLGARLHPDHRADLIFAQVLRAPIPGMNHTERVFLATALFARHTAAGTVPQADLIARLLNPRGRAAGAGARRRHPPRLRPLRPQPRAARALDAVVHRGRRRAGGRGRRRADPAGRADRQARRHLGRAAGARLAARRSPGRSAQIRTGGLASLPAGRSVDLSPTLRWGEGYGSDTALD